MEPPGSWPKIPMSMTSARLTLLAKRRHGDPDGDESPTGEPAVSGFASPEVFHDD